MYREELPNGCPPSDAWEITDEKVVYRLVESDPAQPSDFDSCFKLYQATHGNECMARGVSVHDSYDAVANTARKTPRLRGKRICKVALRDGAGRIKQTGQQSAHCTWWPYAAYDITAACEVLP